MPKFIVALSENVLPSTRRDFSRLLGGRINQLIIELDIEIMKRNSFSHQVRGF